MDWCSQFLKQTNYSTEAPSFMKDLAYDISLTNGVKVKSYEYWYIKEYILTYQELYFKLLDDWYGGIELLKKELKK